MLDVAEPQGAVAGERVNGSSEEEMMDIVEFLRSVEWMCHSDMRGLMENYRPHEAADEIERLRQQNAELVEALKFYACDCQCLDGCSIADCGDVARKAIAKATGGE